MGQYGITLIWHSFCTSQDVMTHFVDTFTCMQLWMEVLTLASTSQAYERVILSAFHSILIVKFYKQVLRLKWDLSIRLWNVRNELFQREKMAMNGTLGFRLEHLKKGMHKKMPCFSPPNKTFDQSNSLEWRAECLCDPLDGNNSIIEHFHKFSCQMCRPQ